MGLEDVINTIKTNNIKTVRFTFTDIYGIVRCKHIPARHFREKANKGLSVLMFYIVLDPNGDYPDGPNGFTESGFGDVVCFPELDTFRVLPWLDRTASVFTTSLLENVKIAACPRHIALRQLSELSRMGYSLLSAHEFEFTVIDRATKKPAFEDTNWASPLRLLGVEKLVDTLSDTLPELGIDVETIQGEHGPGQLEITYKPSFGIKAADSAMYFKTAVKEIAYKQGYSASFMTKPYKQWGSLGTHYNHSLWDQMENSILFDDSDPYKLSKVAKHWIAGIMEHAKAICILVSPTSNCMSRYHSDPVVPSAVSWGIDHRSAALRVKLTGDRGAYFENRMGASAANPYIIMAATVAAGLDGIRRQLSLPPDMTSARREDFFSLPKTQEEALECFLKDDVICKAFGEEFIKAFMALRKMEVKSRTEALAKGIDEYEWAREYLFKYL